MIIAYSGSSGTGKTTSVFEEAKKQKILNPDKTVTVMNELAISCPFPINKKTTKESQLWIFCSQIRSELKLSTISDIVILDRTCVDVIAYSKLAGFGKMAENMLLLAESHIGFYDKIYLKLIKNNPYNFDDGLRETDSEYRKLIEETLIETYKRLNIKVEDC